MYSYSQFGEDRVILEWFPPDYVGSYLDIGANHPETCSNTRLLYELGWSGIVVEPVPAMLRLHREQRPRDVQLPYAIADREGVADFYIPDHDPISTLDPEQAHRIMTTGRPTHIVTVRTHTVRSMLDAVTHDAFAYMLTGKWRTPAWFSTVPDVLSIDVEGYEKQVLSGCPFEEGWLPTVIILEACLPCTETPCHDLWEDRLLKFGYVYKSTHVVNRLYVRGSTPAFRRLKVEDLRHG